MIRRISKLWRTEKAIVLDEVLDYDELLSFLKKSSGKNPNPEIVGWYSYRNSWEGRQEEARINYKRLPLDPAIEFIERYLHKFAKPALNPHLWFCLTRHRVLTDELNLDSLLHKDVIGIEHDLEITAGMNGDSWYINLTKEKGKPKIHGQMRIKLYDAHSMDYFLKDGKKQLSGIIKYDEK